MQHPVIERLRYDEDGYLILQGNLFEKPQLRVGDLCAYVGRQECIEDTYIILKIQNYHGNGVGAAIYNCREMKVSTGFVRLEYNVILAHADDL